MFNPERLLGQVLSGSLGGFGRKVVETDQGLRQMGGIGDFGGGAKLAAGLGLLGVAMAAFEHFRQDAAPAAGPLPPPPPAGLPPPPPVARGLPVTRELPVMAPPPAASVSRAPAAPAPEALSSPALHLLRSMIAAAHADGVLDAQERSAIVGRAREAGLPPEDLMALGAELLAPRTLADLLAQTPSGLERETYAAALLAIRVDDAAEQQYLEQLAHGLRLSTDDCAAIRAQLAG